MIPNEQTLQQTADRESIRMLIPFRAGTFKEYSHWNLDLQNFVRNSVFSFQLLRI